MRKLIVGKTTNELQLLVANERVRLKILLSSGENTSQRTIWNKEFQKSKIGFNVLKLSCRQFFSGHFKTKDFFVYEKFPKKTIFAQIFEILQGLMKPVLATPYEELNW